MTRETKLGLVVGCSFVALTAVVVVSRMRQPEAPPATQAKAAAPKKPAAAADKQGAKGDIAHVGAVGPRQPKPLPPDLVGAKDPPKDDGSGIAAIPPPPAPVGGPPGPPNTRGTDDDLVPPANRNSADMVTPELPQQGGRGQAGDKPRPPVAVPLPGMPQDGPPGPPPVAAPKPQDKGNSNPATNPEDLDDLLKRHAAEVGLHPKPPNGKPNPPALPPGGLPEAPPAPLPPGMGDLNPPREQLPEFPPRTGVTSPNTDGGLLQAGGQVPLPKVEEKKDGMPPAPKLDEKKDGSPVPKIEEKKDNTPLPKVEEKKDGLPPLPALPDIGGKPAPPGVAPPGEKDNKPLPPGGDNTDGLMPPPPAPGGVAVPLPGGPLPTPKDKDKGPAEKPPVPAPAPKDANPGVIVNPPRPQSVGLTPEVKVFDVQKYTCKAGDDSLEAICKRIYGSEKYARALLTFNLQLPYAAAELRQIPPQLKPGVQVHLPPIDVLETGYMDRPVGAQPPQAPGGAHASPVGNPERVQPVPVAGNLNPDWGKTTNPLPNGGQGAAPLRPVPEAVQAGAWGPSAAPTKTYRVPPGEGEHLYEIARRTLGNASRWTEIYRLNPAVNTERRVPGGTILQMPAEARVTQ